MFVTVPIVFVFYVSMGEQNCAVRRVQAIDRRTLVAAAAIYDSMYGCEATVDGVAVRGIEASFNVLSIGAWSPAATQLKPAKRGSATHSLANLPENGASSN